MLTERLLRGAEFMEADVAEGSAAPVRDREMQPFTFEFVGVGICDP
jgi:hypothetical protein